MAAKAKAPVEAGALLQATLVSTSVTCATRSACTACTATGAGAGASTHTAGASTGPHAVSTSTGTNASASASASASARASVGINAGAGVHARAGRHARTGIFIGGSIHAAVAAVLGAVGTSGARREHSCRHQACQGKCGNFGRFHVVLHFSVST